MNHNEKNSKRTLFVCQNNRGENNPKGSCYQKGSPEILAHIKSICKQNPTLNMRATSSGCLGRCDQGPVCVIFPDDIWQTINTTDEADDWLIPSNS